MPNTMDLCWQDSWNLNRRNLWFGNIIRLEHYGVSTLWSKRHKVTELTYPVSSIAWQVTDGGCLNCAERHTYSTSLPVQGCHKYGMLYPGISNAEIFKYPQVSVYAYVHHVNTTASKTIKRVKLSERSSSSPSTQKSNKYNLKHVTYTPSSGNVLSTNRWHLMELVRDVIDWIAYVFQTVPCLGAVAKLRRATTNFVMSVRTSVHLPAHTSGVHNSAPTGRISINL